MTKRLSALEDIIDECAQSGINIDEKDLPENVNAFFYEDTNTEPTITLNRLKETKNQICTIAEEFGHYNTSYGDILTNPDIDKAIVRQQELRAKRWATRRLVSIKSIIRAHQSGCRSIYDMSEYLDVTEDFFRKSLTHYAEMYGACKKQGDYIIFFDPPAVLRLIE